MKDLIFFNPLFQKLARISRGLKVNEDTLFGAGTADTTISGNTTYSSPQFVKNLTINAGVSVTGTNSLAPLIVVVKDTLTVNGNLHMDSKGQAGGAATAAGTAGTFWNWNALLATVAGGAGGSSPDPGGGGNLAEEYGILSALGKDTLLRWFMTGAGGGGGGGSGAAGGAGFPGSAGGGGSASVGSGGAGGTGGGSLIVIARNIVVGSAGRISADGAVGALGSGGGGGGGAGGSVTLIYHALQNGGTIRANGGTGGETSAGASNTPGGAGGTATIATPFMATAGTTGATNVGANAASGGGGASGLIMPLQI